MTKHSEIFTNIYKNCVWGNDKNSDYIGSSGCGGKTEYTCDYINLMRKYINDFNVKTIVDLGCGKLYNGHELYDDLDIKYYGYDIYLPVIVSNICDYESKNSETRKYNFIQLDFQQDPESIVSADLCIIKDVLQHWSTDEIYKFLDYLTISGKFQHILLCNCNFQNADNQDIPTGSFRPLSPRMLPLKKYNPTTLFNFKSKEVVEIPNREPVENILVAILAKNGKVVLPYYLNCIENQTFPAKKIYLYIRTNNNTDNTVEILVKWIKKVQDRYLGVYFDSTDVAENISQYKNHEWNATRFKVLGRLRNESVEFARIHNLHYFVADMDNFIKPNVISEMMATNLPVVAPLLGIPNHNYANFHHVTDANGYLKQSETYSLIRFGKIKGLIQVDVVHCTYFIDNSVLQYVNYNDNSDRYEYVIFSSELRKCGVPQYIDNREDYGWLTFATDQEALEKEARFGELATF